MKVTNLAELEIRLTAVIERGVTENRVRCDARGKSQARRRDEARAEHVCINCFKRQAREGLVVCGTCSGTALRRELARRARG